jgi:hypothetical protein
MNKVRLSAMHPVIVALMAECKPIAEFMAQIGAFVDLRDMMRFESPVTAAMLASVIVSLQHGGLPRQIIGATPPLGVSVVLALGYALAFPRTINVISLFIAGAFGKRFAADLTGILKPILSALLRAIDFASKMRRRTIKRFTASNALNGHLLRLRLSTAHAGTIPLLGVFIPVAIVFFLNRLTADLAILEPFGMWGCLFARYTGIGALVRTVFSL